MGERWEETVAGPMSKESRYRIFTDGPCGAKEIGAMIRTLEIIRDFLAKDEAAEFIGPTRPAKENEGHGRDER